MHAELKIYHALTQELEQLKLSSSTKSATAGQFIPRTEEVVLNVEITMTLKLLWKSSEFLLLGVTNITLVLKFMKNKF